MVFLKNLKAFAKTLTEYVSTNSGEWSIKGFIDVDEHVHTISSDSKIVSKILETILDMRAINLPTPNFI